MPTLSILYICIKSKSTEELDYNIEILEDTYANEQLLISADWLARSKSRDYYSEPFASAISFLFFFFFLSLIIPGFGAAQNRRERERERERESI